MTGRVAVVGSFNVDHVWVAASLPRPGETLAGDYRSGPGGKGFNQAIAAARAGAPTDFICALGDDAGGALARALAHDDGIALHDMRSDAPTGTAGIFVGEAGGNSIVIGPGANAALTPAFVDAQRAVIARAAVVVVQLESPLDAITQALRIARGAGAVRVLNPAPANVAVPAELLALADVITPNETEFAALLDAHAGERIDATAIAALGDDTLHALCRRLLPHGTVVVTLGAAGCFVSHGARRVSEAEHARVPGERADAIDTTGAGDAFNGALAASIALGPGCSLNEQLRFANRYAALSTERAGAAVAMPTAAQVQARFGD
ncbi:ribokinase [Cognatilysobacter bugurensis]|uniref:Ribokinase n=1 Tax=Cognatilysobacter bugurensis TaxID=543356 RepID=A0A918WAD9_9GAMM|nr:ribokinase [Lysobacter bugurensis]GHA88993.1 ribokinase [Lysobacter bugurensis]